MTVTGSSSNWTSQTGTASTEGTAAPRRIQAGKGRSVLSWAPDAEPNTLLQAQRTARSPAVSGDVALMADAHVGIGATIGSVIPTEAAIIPAAVGVDLGCGMTAVRSPHTAAHLPDDLAPALDAIAAAVPAGFNAHPQATAAARDWLRAHPLPDKTSVRNKIKSKMGSQLGTLGGGNHFIEVSVDEQERVWVVLHSGSRGVGNALASQHIKAAKQACRAAGRELEDADLAYLLEGDPGFEAYVADMLWSQDYARANRALITTAVLSALREAVGLDFSPAAPTDRIDCHHNYAERERHSGKTVWVTRKGAIRARVGDRGVIPGSMGDDTYIVSGRGQIESYCSASHGAGRLMSRRQAKAQITAEQLTELMQGRTWQSDKAARLTDEAPGAYRPISAVMDAQRDLVDVEHRLSAVLNYKGC